MTDFNVCIFPVLARLTLASLINLEGKNMQSDRRETCFYSKYFILTNRKSGLFLFFLSLLFFFFPLFSKFSRWRLPFFASKNRAVAHKNCVTSNLSIGSDVFKLIQMKYLKKTWTCFCSCERWCFLTCIKVPVVMYRARHHVARGSV